jgi:hypothetical protein
LGDRCEGCHVADHWTAQLWFEHDLTTFPLIGAHADVTCDQCHASAAFHDAGDSCVVCHADDDHHDGGLGKQCGDCHNPASWMSWIFDHDKQSDFALTGAHAVLVCDVCHSKSKRNTAAISDSCASCHRREDPHDGRFGDNCENCHTTSTFSQIEGM